MESVFFGKSTGVGRQGECWGTPIFLPSHPSHPRRRATCTGKRENICHLFAKRVCLRPGDYRGYKVTRTAAIKSVHYQGHRGRQLWAVAMSNPIDQPVCFRQENPRSCRKTQYFLSVTGADAPAALATVGQGTLGAEGPAGAVGWAPSSDPEVGSILSAPLLQFCRGRRMSLPPQPSIQSRVRRLPCSVPAGSGCASTRDDGSCRTTAAVKRVGILWDEVRNINVTDDYGQRTRVCSPQDYRVCAIAKRATRLSGYKWRGLLAEKPSGW